MNLRIQILDHDYFWRHLNSRTLPESALPQLHPLGIMGQVQGHAPKAFMYDWRARGKLELRVITLTYSCLRGVFFPCAYE